MDLVDLWAAAAAAVAGGALALRSNMLKPHHGVWALAPLPVRWALSGLAIALGMAAVSICGDAQASAREAMVYSVLAVSSVVMTWNLHKNGRADVLARLQGRAGLVTTIELRDPLAVQALGRKAVRRD